MAPPRALRALLAFHDTRKLGSLSAAEFTRAMQDVGVHLAEAQLKGAWQRRAAIRLRRLNGLRGDRAGFMHRYDHDGTGRIDIDAFVARAAPADVADPEGGLHGVGAQKAPLLAGRTYEAFKPRPPGRKAPARA